VKSSANWWIGAIIVVGTILAIVLLTSSGKSVIPEEEEFMRIRSLPYDVATMNCTQKAILYAEHLQSEGWKCWIVLGTVTGEANEHAWVVVVDEKGTRRLCDPTGPAGGPSGYPESTYKNYHPRAYYEHGIIVPQAGA